MHEAARHERERQEQAAQDLQMHKQAFRVAFDLLTEIWPPENTVEYFDPVARKFVEAADRYADNALAKELLLGVYTYVADEARKRENVNENPESTEMPTENLLRS